MSIFKPSGFCVASSQKSQWTET